MQAGAVESRMRLIQYLLIAIAVCAALAISVFLVVRNFSTGPQPPRQETATPHESTAAQEKTASKESTAAPEVATPAVPSADNTAPMHSSTPEPAAMPPAGDSGGRPPEPRQHGAGAANPADAGPPVGARLALSDAQQDKLRYVLLSHNIIQTEVAGFPLRAGGVVPQNIELTPLPAEVADVVPHFRYYSYVFAQNRIVIVLTDRREIGLILSM